MLLAHHKPRLGPCVSEYLRGLCMAGLLITRDLSLGLPRDSLLNSAVIQASTPTLFFYPSIHPQEDLTEKPLIINLKGAHSWWLIATSHRETGRQVNNKGVWSWLLQGHRKLLPQPLGPGWKMCVKWWEGAQKDTNRKHICLSGSWFEWPLVS